MVTLRAHGHPWSLVVWVVSLVLPGSGGVLGGGGDIGGALGRLGGVLRTKKRVLPLLDWPVLRPGLPQGLERTHTAGRPEPQDVSCVSL